uniref:Putative transcriptional regulator n=1 Tax=Hydrogenophaga sp. PL2G6 TaxID=503997 RepID=B4Y318_9BURK|nr:putative transcriptional regulator [Hydrogenophaga sp. PL2G6]
MTTYAIAAKQEMTRVARKVMRPEMESMRADSAAQRKRVLDLERRVRSLEAALAALQIDLRSPRVQKDQGGSAALGSQAQSSSFDAIGFADHRKQLGLTQAQMAKLLGTSALSVYKWERAGVIPRRAQQEKIESVMKLGKRAAAAKLRSTPE